MGLLDEVFSPKNDSVRKRPVKTAATKNVPIKAPRTNTEKYTPSQQSTSNSFFDSFKRVQGALSPTSKTKTGTKQDVKSNRSLSLTETKKKTSEKDKIRENTKDNDKERVKVKEKDKDKEKEKKPWYQSHSRLSLRKEIKSSTNSLNVSPDTGKKVVPESKNKRPISALINLRVNGTRGQTPKLEGSNLGENNLSRASSVTNLEVDSKISKGARPRKSSSRDRIDKIGGDGRKHEKKASITRNNNKLDAGDNQYPSVDSLPEEELLHLRRQLQEMAQEKTNLAIQLGEQKGQLNILQIEIQKLKEESNLQLEHLTEENTALRNRLRDVAHSPLSDNEKQQLLFDSHRHHSSAPASIATNIVDDSNGADTTCTTPDWDKHSSSNVSEVSVACLQDKINQMQETHYSTNEELQATLQELTDLQRQLTELQQENERLNDEKTLMFDSLCRQTERLNDSRSEVESLKQLLYQEKDDTGQFETAVEREQKLVDLLKSTQEERKDLLVKLEQLNIELQENRTAILERDEQIANLKERVNTLECTLDAKHAEHKQLDQELAQAKDQCSAKHIEINRLTDLLDNARTKITELEQDRTLSDKSELDELLDNARKEKDTLESEVAHLKEQLAISKNEIEKTREQVFILQEECKVIRNNAKTTQSDLEYKCEKLIKEKNGLNEQLQGFQDAINELQVQSQCQLEEKRQLSAVLSETQRNLSEAERKNLILEDELDELKRLRTEENDEWEKFQEDLLTSVRVANDFKTEAQQELQRMIIENKTYRDRERQLKAEIEKLKGTTSVTENMDLIFKRPNNSKSRNRNQSNVAGSPTNQSPSPKTDNPTTLPKVKRRENKSLKSKRLKTLSVEEEMLLKSIDNYHSTIDETLPDEFLTEEQIVIKKLKTIYEDDFLKIKPIAPKPKDQLAISKPLLDSVLANPKLMAILKSSEIKTVEDMALFEKEAPEIRHIIQDIDRTKKGKSENFAPDTPESMRRISIIGRSMSCDNMYDVAAPSNTLGLYRTTETDDLTNDLPATKVLQRSESSLVPSDSASNYNRYSDLSLIVNKDLTPRNNVEYGTLKRIVKSIPPDTPESSLTTEQRFALRLLEALEERKTTLKKSEKAKKLPISKPTPDSVIRNPKLKEIIYDPCIKDVVRRKSVSSKDAPALPTVRASKSYDNITFTFDNQPHSINIYGSSSNSSDQLSGAEFDVETGRIGPFVPIKDFLPDDGNVIASEAPGSSGKESRHNANDARAKSDVLDDDVGSRTKNYRRTKSLDDVNAKTNQNTKSKPRDDKEARKKPKEVVEARKKPRDGSEDRTKRRDDTGARNKTRNDVDSRKKHRDDAITKSRDYVDEIKIPTEELDRRRKTRDDAITKSRSRDLTDEIKTLREELDRGRKTRDDATTKSKPRDHAGEIKTPREELEKRRKTRDDVDNRTRPGNDPDSKKKPKTEVEKKRKPRHDTDGRTTPRDDVIIVRDSQNREIELKIFSSRERRLKVKEKLSKDLDVAPEKDKNRDKVVDSLLYNDSLKGNNVRPTEFSSFKSANLPFPTIPSPATDEADSLTYNDTIPKDLKKEKSVSRKTTTRPDDSIDQTIDNISNKFQQLQKIISENDLKFTKGRTGEQTEASIVVPTHEIAKLNNTEQIKLENELTNTTDELVAAYNPKILITNTPATSLTANQSPSPAIAEEEHVWERSTELDFGEVSIKTEFITDNSSLTLEDAISHISDDSSEYDYRDILRENRVGVTSPLNYRLSYKDVVKEIKKKFRASDDGVVESPEMDEDDEQPHEKTNIDKEMDDILQQYLNTRVSLIIKQTEIKPKQIDDYTNFDKKINEIVKAAFGSLGNFSSTEETDSRRCSNETNSVAVAPTDELKRVRITPTKLAFSDDSYYELKDGNVTNVRAHVEISYNIKITERFLQEERIYTDAVYEKTKQKLIPPKKTSPTRIIDNLPYVKIHEADAEIFKTVREDVTPKNFPQKAFEVTLPTELPVKIEDTKTKNDLPPLLLSTVPPQIRDESLTNQEAAKDLNLSPNNVIFRAIKVDVLPTSVLQQAIEIKIPPCLPIQIKHTGNNEIKDSAEESASNRFTDELEGTESNQCEVKDDLTTVVPEIKPVISQELNGKDLAAVSSENSFTDTELKETVLQESFHHEIKSVTLLLPDKRSELKEDMPTESNDDKIKDLTTVPPAKRLADSELKENVFQGSFDHEIKSFTPVLPNKSSELKEDIPPESNDDKIKDLTTVLPPKRLADTELKENVLLESNIHEIKNLTSVLPVKHPELKEDRPPDRNDDEIKDLARVPPENQSTETGLKEDVVPELNDHEIKSLTSVLPAQSAEEPKDVPPEPLENVPDQFGDFEVKEDVPEGMLLVPKEDLSSKSLLTSNEKQILTDEELEVVKRAKSRRFSRPLSDFSMEDLKLIQVLSQNYLGSSNRASIVDEGVSLTENVVVVESSNNKYIDDRTVYLESSTGASKIESARRNKENISGFSVTENVEVIESSTNDYVDDRAINLDGASKVASVPREHISGSLVTEIITNDYEGGRESNDVSKVESVPADEEVISNLGNTQNIVLKDDYVSISDISSKRKDEAATSKAVSDKADDLESLLLSMDSGRNKIIRRKHNRSNQDGNTKSEDAVKQNIVTYKEDIEEKSDKHLTLRKPKELHVILYRNNKSALSTDRTEKRLSLSESPIKPKKGTRESDEIDSKKERKVKSFAQHFEKLSLERTKNSQNRFSMEIPRQYKKEHQDPPRRRLTDSIPAPSAIPSDKKPIPMPRSKNQAAKVNNDNLSSGVDHEVLKMSEYDENFSAKDHDKVKERVAAGVKLKLPKKEAEEVPGLHSSSELLADEFSSSSTDDEEVSSTEEGLIKKSDKFLAKQMPARTGNFLERFDIAGAIASYSAIAVAGTAEKLDLRKPSNITVEPSSLNLFNLESSSTEENYADVSKLPKKKVGSSKFVGENSDTESFDEEGHRFRLLASDSKPKIVDFVPLDEATKPYYKNHNIPDYSTLEREKTFQILNKASKEDLKLHRTSKDSTYDAAKKVFQDLEAKTEQSGVVKVTLTKKLGKEASEVDTPKATKKKVVKRSKLESSESGKQESEDI